MNFPKLGCISAIEVNFMAFDLHKFSRAIARSFYQVIVLI